MTTARRERFIPDIRVTIYLLKKGLKVYGRGKRCWNRPGERVKWRHHGRWVRIVGVKARMNLKDIGHKQRKFFDVYLPNGGNWPRLIRPRDTVTLVAPVTGWIDIGAGP